MIGLPKPKAYMMAAAVAILSWAAPTALSAQDKSGVAGGGIAAVHNSSGAAGVGLGLALSSNINGVYSRVQYRIHMAYAGFQERGELPPCARATDKTCLVEPREHAVVGLALAPSLQFGGGSPLRLRLEPIGAGVFVHTEEDVRETCGTMPAPGSLPPPLGQCERTVRWRENETALGWGLRASAEVGLHLRPLVLQAGVRGQQSFGSARGFWAFPLTIGYFF